MDNVQLDTKQKIIAQAEELFVTHGYEGVSMRELAAACQLSKASLYYYFKDKETLLLEVMETYLLQLGKRVQTLQLNSRSIVDGVAVLIDAVFQDPPQKRAIIRLASQAFRHIPANRQNEFNRLYHEQFVGLIQNFFQCKINQREVQAFDTSIGVWIFLGMMYPFFMPSGDLTAQKVEIAKKLIFSIFTSGVI